MRAQRSVRPEAGAPNHKEETPGNHSAGSCLPEGARNPFLLGKKRDEHRPSSETEVQREESTKSPKPTNKGEKVAESEQQGEDRTRKQQGREHTCNNEEAKNSPRRQSRQNG